MLFSIIYCTLLLLSFSLSPSFLLSDCDGYSPEPMDCGTISGLPFHCSSIDHIFLSWLPSVIDTSMGFFLTASQSIMPLPLPRTVIRSAIPSARGPYLLVPFHPSVGLLGSISIDLFSFRTMWLIIMDLLSNLYRIQLCLPHCIIIGITSFIAIIIDSFHLTLLFSIIFTRIYLCCNCNNRVEIILVNFTS